MAVPPVYSTVSDWTVTDIIVRFRINVKGAGGGCAPVSYNREKGPFCGKRAGEDATPVKTPPL